MDSLTTVAEIGIALAGFSGLVVVLRKNNGPLNEIEKYRMSVLLALAFGAVFLAMLPVALQKLALADNILWRWSSAVLTVFSVVFVLGWVFSSRRFFHVAREIFSVPAFSVVVFGHLCNLFLQLSVTLGFWVGRESGIYFLGLLWMLAHASQQFVRMLFVQPRRIGSGLNTEG